MLVVHLTNSKSTNASPVTLQAYPKGKSFSVHSKSEALIEPFIRIFISTPFISHVINLKNTIGILREGNGVKFLTE